MEGKKNGHNATDLPGYRYIRLADWRHHAGWSQIRFITDLF